MKIIRKGLLLPKQEYYKKHLSIINPMLPIQLSKKEIEVLAAFMALPETLIEDDRFNSVARNRVKLQLKLSPGGLSNYLKSMIKKGFLNKSEISKRITIRDFLIPEPSAQGYQFKIIEKDEHNETTSSTHSAESSSSGEAT